MWWPWAAALAALVIVFGVYGPALNGAFVFDDRYLMFMSPAVAQRTFLDWITGNRPMLGLSYWLDYQHAGTEPGSYHVTNVFLHLLTSVLVALICARFLTWAKVEGRRRDILAVFPGALFLLHPLQTESVTYVASRSEVLSVFFCFAAFALFLYKSDGSMKWPRALAIVVLFGAAVVQEHTVILPLACCSRITTEARSSQNAILYGMIALAGAAGGFVLRTLRRYADTADSGEGSFPAYFYPMPRDLDVCTVVLLPFGQNADAFSPRRCSITAPSPKLGSDRRGDRGVDHQSAGHPSVCSCSCFCSRPRRLSCRSRMFWPSGASICPSWAWC
jgi:hypothetical protein